MARSFDQIYAELGSAYDPSAQLVQQQINAIPASTDALVKQAEAKKDQAFDQILGGARRRGMGFSGIPLQEQAVYASTEFAPAIANVKSQAENRRVSLLEALNSMNRERRSQAQSIFDTEQNRAFAEREFQEKIRQFNEQQAAARAAASGGAGGGGGGSLGAGAYLGGGAPGGGGGGNDMKAKASAAVNSMLQRRSDPSFYRELVAINKSAGYGNAMDQAKLELLRASQPGLFQGGKLNTTRINKLLGIGGGGGGGGW